MARKRSTAAPISQEEVGLLATICEQPEDDTPRLVYSDWLEENHQPARAEFIRLQCQLARLEEEGGKSFEVARLTLRCEAVLKQHRDAWSRPLTSIMPSDAYTFLRFRRGFVESLACRMSWFVAEGEKLFALTPLLRVSLRRPTSPQIAKLTLAEHLPRLRGLRIVPEESEAQDLADLVTTPALSNLKSLNFSSNHYDPLGRYGPRLERVALSLAAAQHFHALEVVDFQNCHIGDAAALALARSPHLPALRQLRLAHNSFAPETVEELRRLLGSRLQTQLISE